MLIKASRISLNAGDSKIDYDHVESLDDMNKRAEKLVPGSTGKNP